MSPFLYFLYGDYLVHVKYFRTCTISLRKRIHHVLPPGLHLRSGTIITEGEAQGDYVPFQRSLNSKDATDLYNNCFRLYVWLVPHWSLPNMAAS